MADNRSLDEFLGAGEPSEPEPESGTVDAVEPTDERSVPDDDSAAERDSAPAVESEEPIEPMAETFAWSATGGECASCGEPVEERWRDGDALVCRDCKAW